MKKLIVVASAVVFAMGLGFSAMAIDPPAEAIKVTNHGKKDAVTFDHAKHVGQEGVECTTCHHQAEGDAANDAANFKCGSCHAEEDGGVAGSKGEGKAPKLKDAAHKKEVGKCWKCHFKASPDVKKELKCADCHKG